MKKEMLTLVIGILIGAIIATGVFLVLKGNTGENMGNRGNMESMGEPPEMNGVDMEGRRGSTRQYENQTTNNVNTTTEESNS